VMLRRGTELRATMDSESEENVGLLNENTYERSQRSYQIIGNVQVWNRNPVFYVMVFMTLTGVAGVCIFAPWVFVTGLALSSLLIGISLWFACYTYDHYQYDAVFSRWEVFKMLFSSLFFLGVTILITYLLVTMGLYRLIAEDPNWKAFPGQCRNASEEGKPLLNCIRAGEGLPNPSFSTGPITFNAYTTSAQNVIIVFEDLIRRHVGCRLINSGPLFAHFRCLSDFWGYPDDLAITAICSDQTSANVWVHSQSRLGIWDYNLNDARVRLISSYLSLPNDYFGYQRKLHDGQKCN